MLKKLPILVACLLFSTSTMLWSAPLEITEAAAHVGEAVTVRGTVIQISKIASGMTFLNFGQRHPNATFTAVIRPGALDFGDLTQYEGKEVEITGTIETFKERPQIVLKTLEDLRLIGEEAVAATPAASATPASTPIKPTEAATPFDSTFQVPLTPAEQKTAGKSPNGAAPTEATVAVKLPPGFDPAQPQRVLVVFATDDGGGAHVQAVPRFARVASAAGWVTIAANGPVLEKSLSPEWHATMILAGLRALKEKYPTLPTWTFYTGGNSGGAARSSMMVGALLAEGYEVKGCFMGGAGGERFSTGLAVFHPPKPKLKKVAVFLSVGTKDEIVSKAMADANAQAIEGVGLRNIQRDSYEGGHGMNEASLEKALAWFASEK